MLLELAYTCTFSYEGSILTGRFENLEFVEPQMILC